MITNTCLTRGSLNGLVFAACAVPVTVTPPQASFLEPPVSSIAEPPVPVEAASES